MTSLETGQTRHTPWNRRDWLILVAVLALGGVLRFWQLGATPPGFQFDEAFNAIDAEQVLQGNRPLFLPANGGREVLFTYFQAGLVALFGSSVWSFRLASALWGTAAVGAAYLLFRLLLRRDSRQIATFAALALAISYWHIHFSHFGIRVITMPVIFSALFGCFWAATQASTRTRRLLLYALAGVLLGASVWSNPTGRLAPIVLVAWLAVLLWRNESLRTWRIDGPIAGLLITGVVAFLVFLPLGLEFLRNPDFFFGHASEVSIFAERVSGESSPLAALGENILHVLGMFSFFGDLEWTHGIPGRPVLDWVIAIPFYIGVVVWALRLFGKERKTDEDGDALWLLALWVVVMLAPSVLSEAAPNYSRTLPALPAALLPVGLGLSWIVRLHWNRPWLGYALTGAILCGSLVWTSYDYFVRFPQMPGAYYSWDVDKTDALAALRARGGDHQLFLSPLWAEHAPVRWARRGSGIKTLDPSQTLVLPQDVGAIYAYTGEEGDQAQALADRINRLFAASGSDAAVAVEVVNDRYDKPLLWLVTLEADQVAALRDDVEPIARFDDAPSLMGASLDADGNVTIGWRADAPTLRNLTAFVHLIDRDGNRIAQIDRIPGDGTYATPTWSAGEEVIDTMPLELTAPCAGGDTVRLVTGWYEYAADGARRPRIDGSGDMAITGEFTAPLRLLLPEEIAPETMMPEGSSIGPLTLLGYSLFDAYALTGGKPFLLDLYYRVDAPAEPQPVQVVSSGDSTFALFGTPSIPAQAVEEPGGVYCQRLRLQVPPQMESSEGGVDWQKGRYPIALTFSLPDSSAQTGTSSTSVLLADVLTISPALPAMSLLPSYRASDARLNDEIALQGYLAAGVVSGVLPVTTIWRALDQPDFPYTAFVQLLREDGSFIVGSDVEPSPTTQRWAPGETHETIHALPIPEDLPAGDYQLVAGMYDALTLERLPATDAAGAPLPDNLVPLGEITLQD